MSAQQAGLRRIFVLLDRLHRPKDQAYGDAWRRRGEALGIFANIARKYDRLEVARGEVVNPGTEAIGDTVADLCVYSGKYLTWLAEVEPVAFDRARLGVPASVCAADVGPNSLTAVFSALGALPDVVECGDISSATTAAIDAFGELEQALVRQWEGQPALAPEGKIRIAVKLTIASALLLHYLDGANPAIATALEQDIEAMEGHRS